MSPTFKNMPFFIQTQATFDEMEPRSNDDGAPFLGTERGLVFLSPSKAVNDGYVETEYSTVG